MGDFPKGGLIGRAVTIFRRVAAMHIPLYAAYAGYFMVLALFPALLLILSVLRYTRIRVESLVALLGSFLPSPLWETMEELVYGVWQNTTGTVLGVAAAAALWSASKGIYGLLKGLNAIYGVSEDRGYVYTRTISVVYTFLFLLVMVLTLILHVFGSGIIAMLTMVDDPLVIFLTDLIDLRFFLLLGLQSLIFTLMFMALPNKRNSFRGSLPGGVFASIGWLVFTDIYSGYVIRFSGYASIYGSVYAIALSMLWLYFCISILFYGGVLNRYLAAKM